jgi:hypothetical protein
MSLNGLRRLVDALRFAIDFAQMDLDHADLEEVSNGIRDFETQIPGLTRGKPESRETLKDVQREALKLLRAVATRGIADTGDLHLRLVILRGDVARATRARVFIALSGKLRDRFLYRLARLLEECGAENLRECSAPDCDRVFFKMTRKKYCSPRCQSRIYMQKYRNGEAGKE